MLTDEISPPTRIDPSNVNRTLPFDKPHHLRHRIFRWNRDEHVDVIQHQAPLNYLAFPLPGPSPERPASSRVATAHTMSFDDISE